MYMTGKCPFLIFYEDVNSPNVLFMKGSIAVPSTIEITEAAGFIDLRCCDNEVDAIGIDWLEAPVYLCLELLCSKGAGDNVKYVGVIQFVALFAQARTVIRGLVAPANVSCVLSTRHFLCAN